MNIAFYLGSLSNGGAERVVVNLCNKLCKTNRVIIITSIKKKTVYEINREVEIYSLDKESNPSNFLCRNINRIKELKKVLKENNINILISFLSEPSFRSLLIKSSVGIPVIVSQRNDPKKEYASFFYRILVKLLYPKADGIVLQTEESKDYFGNIQSDKIEVIFNPVAEEFISDEYNNPSSKKIIAVGRLDLQKNYYNLICAFAKFVELHEEYELHIYGEGPYREQIEKEIKNRHLCRKVFLEGRVLNIKSKLLESEMYVLSSNYEGMPNALIEAMCLGLPVVSTDCPCGGPRNLIFRKDMGKLVALNNPDELEEAMSYFADNEDERKRFGENAKKIRGLVDPNVIADKWINFIMQVSEKYYGKKDL